MAPPAGQFRPGRNLGIFAFIVALAYTFVFATGDHKPTPKLGIELQGGTQVILTARSDKGIDQAALNQARENIEARVNKLGVSGAEVVLDGNHVVITVPGAGGDEAKTLGQTATLLFRPVVPNMEFPAQPKQPSTSGSATPTSGAPTSGAPTSGAPTSSPPSAGAASSSPAPAGRPAPAQQPTSGAPATGTSAPATGSAGAPATSGAPTSGAATDDPCAQYTAGLADYRTYLEGLRQHKVKQDDTLVAKLITVGKKCRQNPAIAPSADGSSQGDQNAQLAAIQATDCSIDPLAGADDPALPLAACDQKGQEKFILAPSILKGTEITQATANLAHDGIGYSVTLSMTDGGSRTWAGYTAAHVGQQAAFVLDSQVVSAPKINGAISGDTEITGGQGGFSHNEAENLAEVLKFGSLNISFDQSAPQTVSATLGLASLRAGLLAGGIGLLLVFIYCLIYYRALGVLTILSLAMSGVIVYAMLVLLGRWIGFTLDLAGIAGFIIAIGITADSFVIFFERLKDEVREGRSFRSAVPRAWVRARRTILSADAVSFLAAAVLYMLAVGQVRGFAFTLGMSTILDLVVVFLVTHPLVALASRSRTLSGPRLSGLGSIQRDRAARISADHTGVPTAATEA